MGVISIVWSLVGLLNAANYPGGAFDALRLHVGWSAAFCLLYCLLRSRPSLPWIHAALKLAAFSIVAINFVALVAFLEGWAIIPDAVAQAMSLGIGIHEGYIQLTANNIESLFLVVPYLIARQITTKTALSTKLAHALTDTLAVVSGRRALLLVLAVTQLTILALSLLTHIRIRGRGIIIFCAVSAVVSGVLITVVPADRRWE